MAVNYELVLLAIVAGERIYDAFQQRRKRRRHGNGVGLARAFHQAGGAMDALYQLYREIGETEGFHSIRMIGAHNGGSDLSTTMLWKGTTLATYPQSDPDRFAWVEQPLDAEYIETVLRPVTEGRWRVIRRDELNPSGPLGTSFMRLGIEQSITFRINRSNTEIVYAAVSFTTTGSITPEQNDAIRACEAKVRRLFA